MGTPYQSLFSKGQLVRIASREALDQFKETWRYHHKLEATQLLCANRVARIASVAYYHGGDVLYELEGAPGIWHECCLTEVSSGE